MVRSSETAYEDYPYKNPLKIYWASVTGCRKVKSKMVNKNMKFRSHKNEPSNLGINRIFCFMK